MPDQPQSTRPSYAELLTPKQQDRFWSNVTKGTSTQCWLWRGTLNDGYGQFSVRRVTHQAHHRAHRIAWELLRSRIPDGLQLDHLCRVRNCVNPAHLEVVTNRENVKRGVGLTAINARKTHCKHGHPLTPDNVRVEVDRRSGAVGRKCKACKVLLCRAQEALRREARRQMRLAGIPPTRSNPSVSLSSRLRRAAIVAALKGTSHEPT